MSYPEGVDLMRRLWASLAILVFLFCAALVNSWYLNHYTNELVTLLRQAESCAASGDWDAAGDKTEAALIVWKDRETYLHMVLQHQDTDQVLLNFQEVRQLITHQEDGGEYAASNARLIAQIELLSEMEELTFKNIF